MKICVIGAGILGSYYTSRLHEGGLDVTLLARGARLKSLKERGILLKNFFTGQTHVVRVKAEQKPEPGGYDLVLIFVRMDQLSALLPLLESMETSKDFLFMGNNITGFKDEETVLGKQRLLAGFGGVGGKREDETVVYVDAPGPYKKRYDRIILGELGYRDRDRINRIKAAFAKAGIQTFLSKDIRSWLVTHGMVISALAGGIYKHASDNYALAEDEAALLLMINAIKEGVKVLQSLKIEILPTKYRVFKYVPSRWLLGAFRRSIGSSFAEIGLAGHADAAKGEINLLTEGIKVLIKKSGKTTPALDALHSYIQNQNK